MIGYWDLYCAFLTKSSFCGSDWDTVSGKAVNSPLNYYAFDDVCTSVLYVD